MDLGSQAPALLCLAHRGFTERARADMAHASPKPSAAGGSGITARAVLLGLLFTAILGVVTPYCDLVLQGTWIASCHLPIGVFVLFVVMLLGVNTPLLHFASRWGFTTRELYTIYTMMLLGAGIPSFGLTEYLFPTIAGAYYMATPENGWIERTFRHIPQWMVPYDVAGALYSAGAPAGGGGGAAYALLPQWMQPGGRSVVVSFYEGLKLGERVPWGAWSVPIITWTFAALVLYWCLACLSTLLRKQWIDHERLVFPLVQVPLELAHDQSPRSPLPSFFRNRWMWLGCAIPLIVHSVNGLHFHYPAFPEIRLAWPLNQYLTGRLWANAGIVHMVIHFSVVGFSYLIATELAFSFWFFFLVFILEGAVFSFLGIQLHPLPGYPTPPHSALQMIGAFLAITGYMAWSGRQQWRVVWAHALGHLRGGDDHEPLPLRHAFWGLVMGLGVLCAWCMMAGLPLLLAALIFVFLLVFSLVLTRLVSEGGLLFVQAFRPSDVIVATAGTSVISPRSHVVLSFIQTAFMFDLRTFLMPSFMDAYRLADASGLSTRRLLPWLGLAIVVAIASSYVALLLMAYKLGGARFMQWFMIISPRQNLTFVVSYLNQPYPTSVANWLLILGGAATTALLSWMRSLHVWWPLHPLGYAMGPSWPMIQLWFSMLLGWLLKSLILRYGGFRRFREAKPFFLGLVVGEFGAAGLWLIVDFLAGKSGHRFFLN